MGEKKCLTLTWLFFNSSSNCLIRDLDHAFIFRNLASDLAASSVFCFAWAAKKKKKKKKGENNSEEMNKIVILKLNRTPYEHPNLVLKFWSVAATCEDEDQT